MASWPSYWMLARYVLCWCACFMCGCVSEAVDLVLGPEVVFASFGPFGLSTNARVPLYTLLFTVDVCRGPQGDLYL